MIFRNKKTQAAAIIREHLLILERFPKAEILVEDACRRMVEMYRLLTDEMPQTPGLEELYESDEEPAVEWATPVERAPDELFYVQPGFGNKPDILIKGDQNGTSQKDNQKEDQNLSEKKERICWLLPEKGEGEGRGKR